MADGVEASFKAATEWVRTAPAPATPSTNEQKLKLYGLYKQATEGDNTSGEPWKIQLEAHAKWSAWTAEKGKSKETAMADYLTELKSQRPDYA